MTHVQQVSIAAALDGVPKTVRQRRTWLRKAPDSELSAWLMAAVRTWRKTAMTIGQVVANLTGAPLAEVVASPFGLRACAMGAAVGASLVHQELRTQSPWDPALLGSAATQDADHGTWVQGALVLGRFEGFCQDQPFATFNPNHSSRWTPHELLHRVCGFAWRPDLDAWWLYSAARLGEVVPVAHWYGTDQVFRLDEDGFDERTDAANPAAALQRALWLNADDSALKPRLDAALVALRAGARWVDAELAAVAQERATGDTVHVSDPLLDSVSDATAYASGHLQRLQHPTIASVLTATTVANTHRFATLTDYSQHIERMFDQLVFGAIEVDEALATARQKGRCVWDVALLATMADPVSALEAFGGRLQAIAGAVEAAQTGDGGNAQQEIESLETALTDVALDDVLPMGLPETLCPLAPRMPGQLAGGVQSAAPILANEAIESGRHLVALVENVVSSHLWTRGPLVVRLRAALEEKQDALTAAAALSEAVAGATVRDDVIEHLALPTERWPDDLEGCFFRRNKGFSRHDAAQTLLVGRYREGISILPLPACVATLWQWLQQGPVGATEAASLVKSGMSDVDQAGREPGWPTTPRGWLKELAEAGAIGLMPASRREP